jgi:hypothetical protein
MTKGLVDLEISFAIDTRVFESEDRFDDYTAEFSAAKVFFGHGYLLAQQDALAIDWAQQCDRKTPSGNPGVHLRTGVLVGSNGFDHTDSSVKPTRSRAPFWIRYGHM